LKFRLDVSYKDTFELDLMSPRTVPLTSMHALEETVEGANIFGAKRDSQGLLEQPL
jgi:hypothetical protein